MGPGLEIFLKDTCILKMKATEESFAQPQSKMSQSVMSSPWGGVWRRMEAHSKGWGDRFAIQA